MKYLIPLLFFLTGCAHQPLLDPGSCYRSNLSDQQQYLISFKIIDFTELNSCKAYLVQALDLFGDPVHPGTRYVKADAALFDKYIAPVVHQFTFRNADQHIVKCNQLKEEPSLNVQGRNP